MKNCKVELIERGKTLAEVEIQRDIFQGDVLPSLSFVIYLGSARGVINLQNHKRFIILCTWTKSSYLQKNRKELGTQIQTIRIYS